MLSISSVNQFYGGSHILRDVSFEVPHGACTAVLGRNGVGKTTLLKCLVGLVPLKSGSLRFGDADVTSLAPYERAPGDRLRAAGARDLPAPHRP